MTATMVAIVGRDYTPTVVGYITVHIDDDDDAVIAFHASGSSYTDFLGDVNQWFGLHVRRLQRRGHLVTEKDRIIMARVCCEMAGEQLCLPNVFEGPYLYVMAAIAKELDKLIREIYIRPRRAMEPVPVSVALSAHEQLTLLHLLRHALVRIYSGRRRRR